MQGVAFGFEGYGTGPPGTGGDDDLFVFERTFHVLYPAFDPVYEHFVIVSVGATNDFDHHAAFLGTMRGGGVFSGQLG